VLLLGQGPADLRRWLPAILARPLIRVLHAEPPGDVLELLPARVPGDQAPPHVVEQARQLVDGRRVPGRREVQLDGLGQLAGPLRLRMGRHPGVQRLKLLAHHLAATQS
jgi:hypothetical protein